MSIADFARRLANWARRPRNALIVGALAVVGALGLGWGVGYVGGVIDGKYRIGNYKQAERVEYKLFGVKIARKSEKAKALDWTQSTKRLETALLNIDMTAVDIPTTRKARGGGLAPFADGVLLLTFEGRIIFARNANEFFETSIATPDNGQAAYAAAAADRFAHLEHAPDYLRFNDILNIETPTGRALVISYTDWVDEENCYRTVVARLDPPQTDDPRALSAAPSDWKQLYATKPCLPLKEIARALEGHTAGGRLAFRAPNRLMLASGDYAWDGRQSEIAVAQDPAYDYGKIIEIDIETGAARQVSQGHRNMQGVAFDAGGDLWAVEHGERGGDELNLIVDGEDYGWPQVTLGTRYSGMPLTGVKFYGRNDAFAPPAFAWLPSIAISSLKPIENFDDSWNGDLLLASLQSRSLFRIRLRDRRVEFVEPINVGQRIRYALPLADGRIVLWTDNRQLAFLEKGAADPSIVFIERYLERLDAIPADKVRLANAIEACQQCHSLNAENHAAAPGLGAIAGAPVASTDFSGYSGSLKSAGGDWTRERLRNFIDEPASVASGTIMPDPGVDDPATQTRLVDFLFALSEDS